MNNRRVSNPVEEVTPTVTESYRDADRGAPLPLWGAALFFALLTVCFFAPLRDLVRLGSSSDLYSHVFLIPVVSGYLIWRDRGEAPRRGAPATGPLVVCAALGFGGVAAYWITQAAGMALASRDALALCLASYLGLLAAGCFAFGGSAWVRSRAFPLAFLVFLVPFPTGVELAIETFLQRGSAEALHFLFWLSGTPFLRDGLVFQLPGTSIEVARECSGIRSSLVLFITSLLAARMFLRASWKRALLVFAVIPLGIFRNALRIFTVALLCVHVDPSMIDSAIHRRGGPVFFAISLVPLFLLLLWLRRGERK